MPEISFSVGRAPSPASSDRRLSIRQTECAFRYKEIIVKKSNNFTQVIFSSKGRMKNSLNVQVKSYGLLSQNLHRPTSRNQLPK